MLLALERISGGDASASGGTPFHLPSGMIQSTAATTTGTQSSYQSSVRGLPGRPPTTVATRRASGERRQVTVVRCGLVARSGQALDPEELLEHTPQLQALVSETVQRFEGNLQPALGGELHATFGYPQAHEDDARRAVHSALELAAWSPCRGDRGARGHPHGHGGRGPGGRRVPRGDGPGRPPEPGRRGAGPRTGPATSW